VYRARVNREGDVVFPRIGAVPVAGLAFGEAKALLAKLFTQQFRNVSVSVAMGQLRSIQIFVVGEVQKPGSYQLSSLSTVLSALFACGGPTATGSLRQIQVLRRGQVVAKVDLYDFLLNGDKSQDIRLQDQDVVFVPLVGPVVGVAGHVQRPAIYEVRPGATLGEVLALAGGVRPTGYLARVQIERIVAHDKRVVIDLNLAPPQGAQAAGPDAKPSLVAERTPIQNMDMVKVFPISPLPQQVVILKGHVVRPGAYELKPGMRVKDVVKGLEELLPEAFLDYARILRYAGPERAKNVVAFNLRRALDGEPSANLELENLDEIEIFSKEEVKALPSVTVVGEVRKPGTYPLLGGMRVSDLIMMAGGLRKVAYTPQADLTRYEVVGSKTTVQLLTVDLERALAGDPSHDLLLRELDRLAVRPIPESEVGRTVMVMGEVKRPGEYAIRRGERLSSVLKRAGGFTERAFPRGLILIRESAKQTQQSEVQKFIAAQKQKLTVEMAALSAGGLGGPGAPAGGMTQEQATLQLQVQALEQMAARLANGRIVVKVTMLEQLEGSPDDVLLEPGDQITVPQQPSVVTILGAVRHATSVVYRPGLGVRDYITQAGGYTDEADESRLYVVKADGSAESAWLGIKQVEAGDTIVVPAKIEPKTRPLVLWQAVASIFGSLLMAIAAIAILAR
jgi:protein involved in polysaccharide export with SLBB domain